MNVDSIEKSAEKLAITVTKANIILINVIFLSLSVEILARNLGRRSIGLNELSVVLLMWVVFLTLVDVDLRDEHIRVDYFYQRFPGRVQRAVDTFTTASVIIISLFIVASGLVVIRGNINAVTAILKIPFVLLYAPVVLGFTFLAITKVLELRQEGNDG